jgi:uncharacterized protein with von Willebrand factor type A (vWA) domain
MNIRDLIARAQATLNTTHIHTPTATDAVIHDRFDEMDFGYIVEDVPAISKNIREANEHFDYTDDFYQDVFNLLHQGDPLLREQAELQEGHRPHNAMSDEFLKSPEFQGLRLSTMHDTYATALAMVSMKEVINDSFKRASEQRQAAKEAQEAREAAQQALQELAAALAAAEADPNAPGAGEALAMALGAVDPAAQAAAQAAANAAQQHKAAAAGPALAMKAAAKAADQNIQEQNDLCTSFGVEDGVLQRMSFEERNRLADKLRNNRLAQFRKLLGQFRNIQAAESRRKVEHAPSEIVGVTLGGDLTRLTGSEMMNLAAPETEDDFWRRYADRELQQYKLEGKEKVGQGPIIVVCDESGSMGQAVMGGTAEAWSKALALALCEQAKQGKRDFIYIGFSSARQQYRVDFPGGKADLEKVIDFTEHFFGGGTHYEEPLRQAGTIIMEYAQDKKPKPDIVFITDDEYGSMDDAFMEWWAEVKKATSMRCFGIAIGCGTSGALGQVSDNTREVSELMSDPSMTADLFRTI